MSDAASPLPVGSVAHVVGARPNFMKAAPVIDALGRRGVTQTLVHTGQHYDAALSDVFFTDLALPPPDLTLGVGAATGAAGQAEQTAALLVALDGAIRRLQPRLVVVYGDVNSTLAAALAAAKTGTPLAHVEAGLRSFDPAMPEEVNRRLTDALADVCLVTSPEALGNLADEGVPVARSHLVGNPMIDSLLAILPRARAAATPHQLGLAEEYALVTLHRPGNVDDAAQARRVVHALGAVTEQVPAVLPLHPRGRERLAEAGLGSVPDLRVVEPLGYVGFVGLMAGARAVVTDSGGVQEETTALGVPCLTLRANTERPVTITHGTNRLVEPEGLGASLEAVLASSAAPSGEGPPLWDGRAGVRIARVLAEQFAGEA